MLASVPAQMTIEAKANVTETTSLGIAPLHMACYRNRGRDAHSAEE